MSMSDEIQILVRGHTNNSICQGMHEGYFRLNNEMQIVNKSGQIMANVSQNWIDRFYGND